MDSSKNKKTTTENKQINSEKNGLSRRTALKALAGIPVLGAIGWGAFKNYKFTNSKRNLLIDELGIGSFQAPAMISTSGGDLIRIGMIGFGARAQQLSRALGFMHPEEIEERKQDGSMQQYLEQEDLNVAIAGVCDPFDLHLKNGLEVAQGKIHGNNVNNAKMPVKQYRNYREMLADKEIDAVVIATPDHHHAHISIEAVKAGKHVYCEKSTALNEDELNELYQVVKNSDRIYQIGHQITQNVIYQQAKDIIEKGILGDITLVQTTTNRNSTWGAWIRHLDENGNPKPGDEKSIDWKEWLGPAPYVPFSIERFYNWTKWFDYDTGLLGQLFSHEFDSINQVLRMGIPHSAMTSGGVYFWKENREMPDVLNTVMEYPDRGMTLTYSATLANGFSRGRVFMGNEATMEIGNSIMITADRDSKRYKDKIKAGIIDTNSPMVTIRPGDGGVDAVTSATEKYYADRGLTNTMIGGRSVDVTHLHVKDWIDTIRTGNKPKANIDLAYEIGVAILMAHKSYLEKRKVEWDPVNRRIV